MPEITHHTRNIRIAPRKLRLVADQLRHMNVDRAIATLPLVNKRGAEPIMQALKAATSAALDQNLDPASLVIQQLWIDEGKALKRSIRFSRGRSGMIMKKYSHIGLVLAGDIKVRASRKAKVKAAPTEESTPAEPVAEQE